MGKEENGKFGKKTPDPVEIIGQCRYHLADLVCNVSSSIVGERSISIAAELYGRLLDPLQQLINNR